MPAHMITPWDDRLCACAGTLPPNMLLCLHICIDYLMLVGQGTTSVVAAVFMFVFCVFNLHLPRKA